MKRAVEIYVRQARAYLPTMFRIEKQRLWFRRDPVLVVDPTSDALATAIERIRDNENHPIELPDDPSELRAWLHDSAKSTPEPRAAGVKSWKAFGQNARAYTVVWTEDQILVQMSGPFDNNDSSFPWDPAKTKWFSLGTPISTIVDMLVQDMRSIPELLIK
jgi:hypothetical protein